MTIARRNHPRDGDPMTNGFPLQPILEGSLLKLRPLEAADFEDLYKVASDPLVWEQHPQKTRYQRDVFEKFFADAMQSKGALLAIDKKSGAVVGTSRFYDFNSAKKEILVGYTFLDRSCWGGLYNQELKSLMLTHAFHYVDRVLFHIGESNLRSQKAIEKIGAQFHRRFETSRPDGSISVTFEYVLNR